VSFGQHKRTKGHKAWEVAQDNKKDKIRSKEFENEIERLKNRLVQKDAVENELLHRIRQLEYERDYWKRMCDGVYL
jgi:hypothetical protein